MDTELSLPVPAVSAVSPQQSLPHLEQGELLDIPHAPSRTRGCSRGRHPGKGLMPPAHSVAAPDQPGQSRARLGACKGSMSSAWQHKPYREAHTHSRYHRYLGQPQAPLLSTTGARLQLENKKRLQDTSAGEGAGAPGR